MILKKLKLKNIRSYKEIEIEFPQGSILLSGDIGAGKTSILLGLQFALFGLQPGQKGSSILRQGEDNAEVNLEMQIDDQDIFIERTLKRAKNGSITQENNNLTIGKEKYELSTSEMKNKIISLLDYPKEFAKKADLLYKFTVYTPQEGMKEIIQEKPETRLDILRHIFGIDRYKRIKENSQLFNQNIKENIKVKESQIRDINILREKLAKNNEDKIFLAREISDLSVDIIKIEEEKKESSANIEQIKNSVEKKNQMDNDISRKEGEIRGKIMIKQRLEKEIISTNFHLGEKINFKREELENVLLLVQKHKQLVEDLNSKFMETNSRIYALDSKKDNSLKLKERIISLENCPTCFQSVVHEHKDKITKKTQYEIEDIQREIEPLIVAKAQLIRDMEREKELVIGYEQDRLKLEKDKVKFENQRIVETKLKSDSMVLERVNLEISDLGVLIDELKKTSAKMADVKLIYEREQKKQDEINYRLKKVEINIAEKKREHELLKRRIEEITEEINVKEKVKDEMNYLRSLQDWIEERFLPMINLTETNVLATLRRDFSKLFNEWFSILVSDALSVRLDEDFTPVISNQDYDMDYDFLSGGERTAVALAYRLALNQIINSFLSKLKTKDLLILDEPTDGFSEAQLDKMRDIFEQLHSKQIILVSHEPQIEGFVDNVIRIKKDGTSKIETNKTL
jgi:exonuclease SbcC